jgi:hypothetical protein
MEVASLSEKSVTATQHGVIFKNTVTTKNAVAVSKLLLLLMMMMVMMTTMSYNNNVCSNFTEEYVDYLNDGDKYMQTAVYKVCDNFNEVNIFRWSFKIRKVFFYAIRHS